MTRASALLLVVAVGACTTVSSAQLVVENGTDLDVTLVVNGQEVGVYPAGGGGPGDIDAAALPSLPWSAEARSPSGRLLTSMEVRRGDLQHTIEPGGTESFSSTIGRVDLSCGRLTIWAGYVPPSGPAFVPNAGEPGDCQP